MSASYSMGLFHLFTPLANAFSFLKKESGQLDSFSLPALAGEMMADIDGLLWKATTVKVCMEGARCSVYSLCHEDNSALNIELTLNREVDSTYFFAPDLRRMKASGKENALLYLPGGSRNALDFLATTGCQPKPGMLQVTEYNLVERFLSGRFFAHAGNPEKSVRITGAFNRIGW